MVFILLYQEKLLFSIVNHSSFCEIHIISSHFLKIKKVDKQESALFYILVSVKRKHPQDLYQEDSTCHKKNTSWPLTRELQALVPSF